MKNTASIISRYTCDTSGICSALYELGGMTVMHDAGGYASIYATHDEPRWYHSKSMIFVTGLTETQAILGDDSKFIHDTILAAQRLKPRFVALTGSPIPMVIGTDFPALALEIEHATDIPAFGFNSDGMHTYVSGVSMAMKALAQKVVAVPTAKNGQLSVNILGATPLDFSINGTVESMVAALTDSGIKVQSTWAMNSYFEAIAQSAKAQVNLVVSAGGLQAAKVLKKRFGMPYVVGTPIGLDLTGKIITAVYKAIRTGENQIPLTSHEDPGAFIIGENVTSMSLANALYEATGFKATVLSTTESEPELLSLGAVAARDEDDIEFIIKDAKTVIADPLYQPIVPEGAHFVPLPHEAFSGRIYHQAMPNLVTEFEHYREKYEL